MSLTLKEYREIISWYAKTKYYERQYGNAAPPSDQEMENRIHRKLRESVKDVGQKAQEEA